MFFTKAEIIQAIPNLWTFIKSNISSLAMAIITVVIFLMNRNYDNKIRLIDLANRIYATTFSLRVTIEKMHPPEFPKEFYYELDLIFTKEDIENVILDYLNEMENFFALAVNNRFTKKFFKKIISSAFYQRVVALYPYILYKREITKNEKLFPNYEKAIIFMKNTKQIQNTLSKYKKKCYIGIRTSDIIYSNSYFDENVCLFSDSNDICFPIRPNQNLHGVEMSSFYQNAIIQKDSNTQFVFYNQAMAYHCPKKVLEKSLCVNSNEIITLLNNKLEIRKWFAKHRIPFVSYETCLGREITKEKLSKNLWGATEFVIQEFHGGGGIGTFHVSLPELNLIKEKLIPLQQYIVSPYLPSISANTHIFVAKKQNVISPGSIQIIEEKNNQLCYRGCDFIAFKELSSKVKEKIKNLSLEISNLLRKDEYLGIAGIDFIIDKDENVYCSEINPRFQASTLLIDRFLSEQAQKKDSLRAKSCFEINEMAFHGSIITELNFESNIPYSCYYYYSDGINLDYYKEKLNIYSDNSLEVHLDGAKDYMKQNLIDNNSYLFRAVFPHRISKISPDNKLWISDNVKVVELPKSELELKIALLNQGVRLNLNNENIKPGVYSSIDIKIKANNLFSHEIEVNCAYQIHFSEYSPFNISETFGKLYLYYYNVKIAEVEIEKNILQNFSAFEQKILYLATDRLRIKIVSGCENKNMGTGCAFCDVPISNQSFSTEEIQAALEHLKKENIPFRHILIGGGTSLGQDSWDKIINLCKYLKNDIYFQDKPISLMSVLPPKAILSELKKAGIQEVAFNMEIANDLLGKRLMPAKRDLGKKAYYETFQKAIQFFGVGNVRSALLVGIDKEAELYQEIKTLAKMGVLPCLSAFRVLSGSEMELSLNPDNQYLQNVYETTVKFLKNSSLPITELGPKCPHCRNNMLIL